MNRDHDEGGERVGRRMTNRDDGWDADQGHLKDPEGQPCEETMEDKHLCRDEEHLPERRPNSMKTSQHDLTNRF